MKSFTNFLLLILTGVVVQCYAQNPIVPPGVYIADPSAHVWNDGKLYIYGSLDESPEYYCSHRHHVFSTSDLKSWILTENVFSSKGENDTSTIITNLVTEKEHYFHEGGYMVKRSGKNINNQDKITVAAYYFPNYHTNDPRNIKIKGTGWSEWELVKTAKPRFPGHHQPNVPLWGYTDEKDPLVMAQKIDAAADNGIDCFIFDWYMYEDGPFLNRCIDEGFLKAKNCDRIKFGLMWANHDWVDIHPYTLGAEQKLLYPGKVSPQRFDEICDFVIKEYFAKPNYWKIDGKAYFSVYDVQKFVEGFGSMEATKAAMDRMRDKAIAAGLKGVHWNLVAWGNPILPVEKAPSNTPELIKMLGFDSSTSYVWIHHVELPKTQTDYNYVRDAYFAHWDKAKAAYGVPYFPNVTMGWDPTPRCDLNSEWANVGYPFMNTLSNNTPENFKKALRLTKEKLLAEPHGPRILNINCWNEWTEGSYLEPDTVNGMKYLEAVKEVFK